jgi:integrase
MQTELNAPETKKQQKTKAKGNGSGTVYQRGEKWCWQLTVYQGLKRVTVSGTCNNRTEARAELAKAIAKRENGGLTAPDKITFGEWLDRWLDDKKSHVRLNTYVGYKSDIEAHIKPKIGHLRMQAIKPIDLKNFYSDLAKKKAKLSGRGKRKGEVRYANRTLSASTQRQVHSVIYSSLQEAMVLEIIPRNVAQIVKPEMRKIDRNAKASTAWTAQEAATFLDFAKADRLYPLFYLMLSLGLRRGEAVGLRWQNVDLTNARVRIVETIVSINGQAVDSEPKTEKSRRSIKLPVDVVEVLKAHQEEQRLEHIKLKLAPAKDWVFTSLVGTALNPDTLDRTFKSIIKKAGVRDIRLHDLRHTHASLARRQGVSLEVVSGRLGHSRPSFTADVYRHTFEDELEDAALPLGTLLSPRVGLPN